MKKLRKMISALALSVLFLLPTDLLSVSLTACAAEEHVCGIDDDHCGHEEAIPLETTYLELKQYAASDVAAPTASRKSGTIDCKGETVSTTLTASDNSTIYYSVNGGSYKKASSPVNVKLTKNTTLETYAEKNGKKSSVVTYDYKLKPTLSFSTSDFGSSKKVWISTKPSDVKVYYTTDGSKPTTQSKKYTSSGITLTKTSTVKVLAVKSGWSNVSDSKKVTVSGSGSGSTSAVGRSSISTPSEDKANVRYNGGEIECEAKYWRSSDDYNKYDSVTVSTPDGKLYIHLAADSTLRKGGTDDVAKNVKLGTTCIGIDGFKAIDGGKYHCTGPGNNYIEKATITAIALDRTGKNPTILYFYVLASDPSSGKKVALEGIVKYTISNSADSSSKSSSSDSTSSSKSSSSSNSSSGSSSSSSSSSGSFGNNAPISAEFSKFISKGTETRDCGACNTGNCVNCYGSGLYLGTTCQKCSGTGKCTVCNGTHKIKAKVNVIDENAVPEGKEFNKCTRCQGSGVCHYCNGTKRWFGRKCSTCSETGICSYCDGSGGELKDKPAPSTESSSSDGSSSEGSSSDNSGSLNMCFSCNGTGNCSICHGGGLCQVCFGRGGMSVPTYGQGGSGWVTCKGCNGSRRCKYCFNGKCKTCGGSGKRY